MRQDILIENDGSYQIVNGDFNIGESDQQHIELILGSNPNDWKRSPITGAGLIKNLGGNLTGFAKRNVTVQLEADGYALDKINESENGLNVTATIL